MTNFVSTSPVVFAAKTKKMSNPIRISTIPVAIFLVEEISATCLCSILWEFAVTIDLPNRSGRAVVLPVLAYADDKQTG